MAKYVDSNHYHLWSDALHARALAHQTKNRWDRGTYIRWCINTAWTVLEMSCQDALDDNNISYSFQKNLNEALKAKSFPKLKWGEGLWQNITQIQELRKDSVHRFANEVNLFPEASIGDMVIDVIRKAIVDIYQHTGNKVPKWVADDDDPGWDKGVSFVHTIGTVKGADMNDPCSILIKYIYQDREYVSDVLPPEYDWQSRFETLIEGIRVPITKAIVCQGDKILKEQIFSIRGN